MNLPAHHAEKGSEAEKNLKEETCRNTFSMEKD